MREDSLHPHAKHIPLNLKVYMISMGSMGVGKKKLSGRIKSPAPTPNHFF